MVEKAAAVRTTRGKQQLSKTSESLFGLTDGTCMPSNSQSVPLQTSMRAQGTRAEPGEGGHEPFGGGE